MRQRLLPTPAQAAVMAGHCRDARTVWNLALEQANLYRPHWGPTPGHLERNRQLTEARAAFAWLAAGSQTVQQQALRDFDQAMRNWWGGSHRRPTWRKVGVHEGFQQVGIRPGNIRRLNRRTAEVWVPKVGWVRFRWTRQIPVESVRSYRVKLDRAGRWHVAFAIIPAKIQGPGDGSVVGVDRGIANSVTLSTGERWHAPPANTERHTQLQRRLSRTQRGSNRRQVAQRRLARHAAREADRRKDWVEQRTTELARRFDVVVVEDLKITSMVRSAKGSVEAPGKNVAAKAGLNRSILAQCWGGFARRCADKGTVVKVPAAFTSQRCSACGEVDANSRKSQAKFACTACGHLEHADVNAAKNIAAGQAVTGRGAISKAGSNAGALAVKRQPQLAPSG